MRSILVALAALALTLAAPAAFAQTDAQKLAQRNATRESLRKVLDQAAQMNGVKTSFRQSDKNPYNFVGVMQGGLNNVDLLEIVIGVTDDQTIGFRIFPQRKGAYVNLLKAKDPTGLSRKMVEFNDKNFLFWGADGTDDIFSGYTFTLESGFPEEAIKVVLYSVRNTDGFVGQMLPQIDGTAGK